MHILKYLIMNINLTPFNIYPSGIPIYYISYLNGVPQN